MSHTNKTSGNVQRTTLKTIKKIVAEGGRFACLTCYEATIARWLERAGLPMILVGDTAGEIVQGHDQTYYADLDLLIKLTAGVRRGAPNVCLMADMPFMSYQASDTEALHNAARFMCEGGADLVKFEVDRTFAPLVAKAARAGIPTVCHIGSRPQQTKIAGGYRSFGKSKEEADRIVDDALALEDAGAIMLLIEATPAEVAKRIVDSVSVPVIGCGAGPACHGQVVVLHDLLGLTDWQPKFAQPVTDLGKQIQNAAATWIDMVKQNNLGDHPYHMVDEPKSTAAKITSTEISSDPVRTTP